MKYPKVLQVLAIATAISLAAPGVLMPAQASETAETPQEYAARTGYVLPAGYHYVLDGEYVILDDNDMPLLEEDLTPTEPELPTPEMPAEPETSTDSETPEPEKPTESETPEKPTESETPPEPEKPTESETLPEPEKPIESEILPEPEKPTESETPEKPTESEITTNPEVPAESGKSEKEEIPEESGTPAESDTSKAEKMEEIADETDDADMDNKEDKVENGEPAENGEQTENADTDISRLNNGDTSNSDDGNGSDESESVIAQFAPETEAEPFFMTSAQFRALHERIQYNVEVPIEGLPSFITQEMVVGALKAQDETGYPASVTIAQIIQESGFGKYGPGGEDGKGLSYLAFEYCNLFGIKGAGTAGSVTMKTSEMESDGSTYSIHAGFRVYHTYTECIEDRSKILEEVYSDLTENVTDANTFAMRIGKRWATSINYGRNLIDTMRRYDLYRLDDMTLNEFSEMIGEFANPCPGSTITSLFGWRTAPIAGATTYHKGLDMGTGAYNIPTYAAKAGTVIFAGEAGACGNMITIDHGDGLVTKYMHHAEIYVKEGDTVEQGQQIGLSGTTGNSTGNHLHFQVEENGIAVDPLKYLQASAEEAENAKKAYVEKQAKAVSAAKQARILLAKALIREN